MAEALLQVKIEAPLALLTLSNPERRNALSLELMRQLIAALEAASGDAAVRVVILAAEGPAFSAGHDLRELTCEGGLEQHRALFSVCTELMNTVRLIPQPVIAQVDGIATAAGCQLVATCDLAMASMESKFATPGVKIGLFCSTPMVPVSRAIGRKRALEMLLTGRVIDAETAAEWGLINRAVTREELQIATRALALEIANASPFTLGLGKRAFYDQIDLSEADAYALTKEVMSRNATEADAQEGMTAFLEKRKPVWRQGASR